MGKCAIIFPGQASQYVGMGKDIYDASAEVRKLYQMASEEMGEDMARLSFEGSAERLKETRFTQPGILLHSLAALIVLKDDIPAADLTAGHSLGEYGSLALAGILSYEDAIRAVIKRASLMEEACRRRPGTMAAVIGLDENKIEDICKKASGKGVVVPANFNSGSQIVISGAVEGVEEACRLCKEAGAKRAMVLQVGGAFHSPLMEPAVAGMKDYLDSISFNEPKLDVVPNVTAAAERNPDNIRRLLLEQLTAPVKWRQTMAYIESQGVDRIYEIGPGKVLTGLAKREVKGAALFNIDTLTDIENLAAMAVK